MAWLKQTGIRAADGSPFGDYTLTGTYHPLESVKLEVPVIPATFYCAGFNYLGHIKEHGEALGGRTIPQKPDIGYRAVNALIAHEETVVIPHDATEKINYEGELVVVIGKQAKNLTVENALGLCAWLHHRQRCQRTHLASQRRHPVALQKQRHIQTHGPVDRNRSRPRCAGNHRTCQRQREQPLRN